MLYVYCFVIISLNYISVTFMVSTLTMVILAHVEDKLKKIVDYEDKFGHHHFLWLKRRMDPLEFLLITQSSMIKLYLIVSRYHCWMNYIVTYSERNINNILKGHVLS